MPHKVIAERISHILNNRESIIVAIDGRCASGKTTLAKKLQKELFCNVIQMDDFFLRPEQRTQERLSKSGENVDHERFLCEVLQPLSEGKTFFYRPYICKTGTFGKPTEITPNRVNIIEGSYSCHPDLWAFYDLHIFLDVPKDIQLDRILKRNGKDALEVFKNKWIPLEEKYFEEFDLKNRCELSFCMGNDL